MVGQGHVDSNVFGPPGAQDVRRARSVGSTRRTISVCNQLGASEASCAMSHDDKPENPSLVIPPGGVRKMLELLDGHRTERDMLGKGGGMRMVRPQRAEAHATPRNVIALAMTPRDCAPISRSALKGEDLHKEHAGEVRLHPVKAPNSLHMLTSSEPSFEPISCDTVWDPKMEEGQPEVKMTQEESQNDISGAIVKDLQFFPERPSSDVEAQFILEAPPARWNRLWMEPPSIVCSTTITSDVPGAKIYYTTNGSEPTQTNFEQTGPSPQVLQVEKSTTLRAMYLANGKTSQLAEAQFILEAPPATLAGNGKCISEDTVATSGVVLIWLTAFDGKMLCLSCAKSFPLNYTACILLSCRCGVSARTQRKRGGCHGKKNHSRRCGR